MDCEKLQDFYRKLSKAMEDLIMEEEFFEDIYRELARAMGGRVPEWVKRDEELFKIFKEYSKVFDANELVFAALSPSYFHPCEAFEFIEMLEDFFSPCTKIYFYPLESTLHLAVLFPDRACSFPAEAEKHAGYIQQLASICKVRIEQLEKGDCALLFEAEENIPSSLIGSFERVTVIGKVPMYRTDLDYVMRCQQLYWGETILFFKKGGNYEKLLKDHPLFYDFVAESAWPSEVLGKMVPLGEIAKISRVRKEKYIRGKCVLFSNGQAEVMEEGYAPKGSFVIETDLPELVREVLNLRIMKRFVKVLPLQCIPVPLGKTDEDAAEFRASMEELEKRFLGLKRAD